MILPMSRKRCRQVLFFRKMVKNAKWWPLTKIKFTIFSDCNIFPFYKGLQKSFNVGTPSHSCNFVGMFFWGGDNLFSSWSSTCRQPVPAAHSMSPQLLYLIKPDIAWYRVIAAPLLKHSIPLKIRAFSLPSLASFLKANKVERPQGPAPITHTRITI